MQWWGTTRKRCCPLDNPVSITGISPVWGKWKQLLPQSSVPKKRRGDIFPGVYGINTPSVQSRIAIYHKMNMLLQFYVSCIHLTEFVLGYTRTQLFRDKLHKPETHWNMDVVVDDLLGKCKRKQHQFQWSGQKPYPVGHLHHCLLGSLCSLHCSDLHGKKKRRRKRGDCSGVSIWQPTICTLIPQNTRLKCQRRAWNIITYKTWCCMVGSYVCIGVESHS